MTARQVVPRTLALRDVEGAIDFYLAEAGEAVAQRFIDSLERAYKLIGERPGVGSTSLAAELSLPGLRNWPLRGFPYVVFYQPRPDHIDVWRVLHASRDIPAGLRDDAPQG